MLILSDWKNELLKITYIWYCQGQGGSALNDEEKKMIEEEFDFEANLAKFDKERTMAEIEENQMSNEPDVVRLHQR